MNVLHVITSLDRGGAENHIFQLARSQRSFGDTVSVAYLQGNGYWRTSLEAIGIQTFNLRGSSQDVFQLIKGTYALFSLMRCIKPDVVHAHLPPAELTSFLALCISFSSARLIITKHLDGCFFSGSTRMRETLLGASLASMIIFRSKSVICVSKSVANYILFSYRGVGLRDKLKVVYHGINPAPFELAASNTHKRDLDHTFVIGTAARLVPQKSLDTLLYSFRCFAQQVNTDCKLRIAGDGPLYPQLTGLAEALEISHLVEWCGHINNIPEFMASLDVFTLTSSYEGLGLVILEAMAARLPVVTSNVSAMPEIVVSEVTGILAEPGEPSSFTNAFLKLYSDRSLRSVLGNAGHHRLISQFSVDKMTKETYSAYK